MNQSIPLLKAQQARVAAKLAKVSSNPKLAPFQKAKSAYEPPFESISDRDRKQQTG